MQFQATRAIANLAAEDVGQGAAIVSEGAISPLVRVLETTDEDIQVWASMWVGAFIGPQLTCNPSGTYAAAHCLLNASHAAWRPD